MLMLVANWPRQLWFGNEIVEELSSKDLSTELNKQQQKISSEKQTKIKSKQLMKAKQKKNFDELVKDGVSVIK